MLHFSFIAKLNSEWVYKVYNVPFKKAHYFTKKKKVNRAYKLKGS